MNQTQCGLEDATMDVAYMSESSAPFSASIFSAPIYVAIGSAEVFNDITSGFWILTTMVA